MVKGRYYYHGFRDYARAIEEFLYARQLEPGNGLHAENIAHIQRRQGRFEEALENLLAALEYDPRSAHLAWRVAITYRALRRWNRAEHYDDRFIELAPDAAGGYIDKALISVALTGKTGQARSILAEGVRQAGPDPFQWELVQLDMADGLYQEALDRLAAISEEAWEKQSSYIPKHYLMGWSAVCFHAPVSLNSRTFLADRHLSYPASPTWAEQIDRPYQRCAAPTL